MIIPARTINIILSLIIAFLVFSNFTAIGQNKRQKLEADRIKIEEEINYTSHLLDQTRKTRKNSLNELIILNNQIKKREALINTINSEISELARQIGIKNDSIKKLDDELVQLKEEYAKMIYFAYKNRSIYNRLMFVFAAEDFNQAYRRLKYFQQYSTYRKTQANLILETQGQLSEKKAELEVQQAQKASLLEEQQLAFSKLTRSKNTKNHTVVSLGKKEKELKKKLKAKEKAAANLEKAIKDIIAEEIRLAAERAKRETSMKTADEMSLTPSELILSENFTSNKGKLPWPSDRGIISSTFGEQPHPILKKITIKNNGVDIVTDEGAKAKAIFEGEVTRVVSVPNYSNVVIIRHGEFLTVYSNLNEVYVKKGDKVATLQALGSIYTNNEEGKTELHFEIWKAKTLQNPLHWLMKK